MWVAGIRPYQITRNFAMQYELGYEYRMTKTTKSKRQRQGGLTKVTVAPTQP